MTTATPPSKKKKGPFRRLKRRFLDGAFKLFGPPALAFTFRLLTRSLRIQVENFELLRAAFDSGRPVILAFLHEDLLAIFSYHIHFRLCPISVMLSQSRDGEMLAPIISRFGLVPIRSSASRGAIRGILETYRWLTAKREGPSVTAIAVDGPRGPRRKVKIGTCMLARKAGALVLPIAFTHSRPIVFNSWDRMQLPKPFTTSKAWIHPPLDANEWDGNDEAHARKLEEIFGKLKQCDVADAATTKTTKYTSK